MHVDHRGGDIAVPEQLLNRSDVGPLAYLNVVTMQYAGWDIFVSRVRIHTPSRKSVNFCESGSLQRFSPGAIRGRIGASGRFI